MALAVRAGRNMPWSVGIAGLAGLANLLSLALVPPVAVLAHADETLLDYTFQPVLSNLAALGLLAWALRRDRRRFSLEAIGFRPITWADETWRSRTKIGATSTLVLGAIGISPLSLWLLEMTWDLAPGPAWALGTPDTYRGAFPLEVSGALIAFQLLLRIPLTVFTEEALFRGYLQPRIPVAAPVIAGLLFAAYHLNQWWTIPQLVPFSLALGVLRWWTGSVWPGAVMHYLGNAAFLLRAV